MRAWQALRAGRSCLAQGVRHYAEAAVAGTSTSPFLRFATPVPQAYDFTSALDQLPETQVFVCARRIRDSAVKGCLWHDFVQLEGLQACYVERRGNDLIRYRKCDWNAARASLTKSETCGASCFLFASLDLGCVKQDMILGAGHDSSQRLASGV